MEGKKAKKIMDIFLQHYPERLYKCLIIDAPWAFKLIWNVLSPFFDAVTMSKMNFLNHRKSAEFKKIMAEHFELDQLEAILGGTCPRYNFDECERPGPAKVVFKELQEKVTKEFYESKRVISVNTDSAHVATFSHTPKSFLNMPEPSEDEILELKCHEHEFLHAQVPEAEQPAR